MSDIELSYRAKATARAIGGVIGSLVPLAIILLIGKERVLIWLGEHFWFAVVLVLIGADDDISCLPWRLIFGRPKRPWTGEPRS